jgi:putative transposase
MPRQSRIDFPGALHHIIVRGIERRTIFEDDQDRYKFIERLGKLVELTDTGCLAWALLPNHVHLLLRTGGATMISSIMSRLLTGHATYYNRRHARSGHLFQNRYKSILCQEDTYLLELVRYIHLNPIRADLVSGLKQLARYPFSGHGAIMGKYELLWQDTETVLAYFGNKKKQARNAYRTFVGEGLDQGRGDDLTSGGLIHGLGGWTAAKHNRNADAHTGRDERILGDRDFVAQALSRTTEALERRYALQASGVDVDVIAGRIAQLLNMDVQEVWQPGKYKRLVTARSLLCFWAVRELGESMASMARRLGISTVAVSKSVERGKRLAKEMGLSFFGK